MCVPVYLSTSPVGIIDSHTLDLTSVFRVVEFESRPSLSPVRHPDGPSPKSPVDLQGPLRPPFLTSVRQTEVPGLTLLQLRDILC